MPNTPLKPVISTDPQTGKETSYPAVKVAAAALNVRPCQISTACVTGHKCHGLYWRKENEL